MFAPIKFLYLTQQQVHDLRPSYKEIVALVEASLRDKARGRSEMPPKIAVHLRPGKFIHAKPGYLGFMDVAGIKWQSNIVDNPKRNLPNNLGTMVLNEPVNGVPRAIMDCGWITAFRTPAATMATIKQLRSTRASVVTIIGLGIQGHCHFDALIETGVVPHLAKVKVFDVKQAAVTRFVAAKRKSGMAIEVCKSPQAAVRDSDIVITCTALFEHPTGTVRSKWLKPGVLALPVEVGCYWTPESRRAMDKIFTDDIEQTQSFVKRRFFAETTLRLDAEIGDILIKKIKGRRSDDENIMCINCGLSLYDIALAQRIYERAQAAKIGRWLPW
jgi:ornithine cyclodeaminase/alanine dehydrogenase